MAGQIIITFNGDGTSNVETVGIKGKSCKDASEFLESALGKKTGETLTREFYEKEQNNNLLRRK
jgi:hypothetical protein